MSESKSLAAFTLAPSSFDELEKVSKILAQSQIVPSAYQNKPANVAVAVMWGQEIGLSPLQALTGIAVINGKGSLYGDAALSLIITHKDFEDIEEIIEGEGELRVAVCRIKRKGRKQKEVRFSVQDAKDAFLWDTRLKVKRWENNVEKEVYNTSPWFRYQNRMLQMRARGFCMRDTFPDALRGISIVEEHQGGEQYEEIDITPAKPENEYMPKPKDDFVDNVIYGDVIPAEKQPEKTSAPAATKTKKGSVNIATGECIIDADVSVSENEIPQEVEPEYVAAEPETVKPLRDFVPIGAGQLKLIEDKLNACNIEVTTILESLGIRKLALTLLSLEEGNACLTWIRTLTGGR